MLRIRNAVNWNQGEGAGEGEVEKVFYQLRFGRLANCQSFFWSLGKLCISMDISVKKSEPRKAVKFNIKLCAEIFLANAKLLDKTVSLIVRNHQRKIEISRYKDDTDKCSLAALKCEDIWYENCTNSQFAFRNFYLTRWCPQKEEKTTRNKWNVRA